MLQHWEIIIIWNKFYTPYQHHHQYITNYHITTPHLHHDHQNIYKINNNFKCTYNRVIKMKYLNSEQQNSNNEGNQCTIDLIIFINTQKSAQIQMNRHVSYVNPQNILESQLLKTMKQRVLREAYEQSLNQKSEKTAISTQLDQIEQSSGSSIKASRSVGDLPKSYRIKTASKNLINFEETLQIQPRSLQKREKDRISLMQQKDLLCNLQRHQSLQLQRQKSIRQDYKRQLQQQIQRKQSQKQLAKSKQKQFQKSKLNRQDSINNKLSSFKEFYDHAYKVRDNVAQEYLQYVNYSKEKQEREIQKEKYDLQRNRNLLKVQMLQQYKIKRQKRQQLKRTLQQQMLQKNSSKQNELNQFKNRGYIKYQTNNYNPIYNPIDYKMDLNNKYVLNEIIHRNVEYK